MRRLAGAFGGGSSRLCAALPTSPSAVLALCLSRCALSMGGKKTHVSGGGGSHAGSSSTPLSRPTLEHPAVGKPDGRGGVIIGDPTKGVRDNLPYLSHRAEFVGRMFPLVRPRTDAGDVLALIDRSAGRASMSFLMEETNMLGPFRPIQGCSMATISFNSFSFPQPVFEGDLVSVESRVIYTSASSLAVHSLVQRQGFDSPIPSYVGEAYVTFVVVDAKDITKPRRGMLPAVRLSTQEDVQRSAAYVVLRNQNKEAQVRLRALHQNSKASSGGNGDSTAITVADVELAVNKTKPRRQRIRDTTIVLHHTFRLIDLNANNVIFGGEILRVLERAALHCGRVFAHKARLFTLAMLGMTFDAPMLLSDMAMCRARVLCVTRSTLLVRVEIVAESTQNRKVTNSADFVLVAVTEEGKPFEIKCGIDLTDATTQELQWYARARRLLEESAKNRIFLDEAGQRRHSGGGSHSARVGEQDRLAEWWDAL